MELTAEAQALAQGILLGDKTALPSEMLQTFRTAGMSHMLAVSGLHVGIIMTVIWALLKPLEWLILLVAPQRTWVYYSTGICRRLITIGVTCLYVWRIGAPVSAVRATVMLSLCLLGWMLHRPISAWRCLVFAALILLAWSPTSIMTPGFQLSFLAVVGILLFQPWLQTQALPRWLRLILLSVAAQWLTAPVVAWWFHQVPLLGWLQGLLVVPLLPLFVTLLLLLRLWPACAVFVMPVNALTSWMGSVAQQTGRLEQLLLGGHLVCHPALWQCVVAEGLLLSIVMYFRLGQNAKHKTR